MFTAFLKKEKVTVLPHPHAPSRIPQALFHVIYFASEIGIIPCWAEISVPTGTWISHLSVPYYCSKISVPLRLQEVAKSAETLHF